MFQTAKIVEAYLSRPEDRAEVIPLPSGLLIVVADGVGGISGGAEAADLAVSIARESAAATAELGDAAAWVGLLAEMDRRIRADRTAGETTAVLAAVSADGLAGASVGDSGAWLISPAGCTDLTARQQAKPFLGSGAAWPVDFAAAPFEGTLLVATDGLFKYARRDRICQVALQDDLQVAAKQLVDLVRLTSGRLPDDVALVLCRPRTQPPATSH